MHHAHSPPATTMYPSVAWLNVRRTIPWMLSWTCSQRTAWSRTIRRRGVTSEKSKPRWCQSLTLGIPHLERQNGCPAGSAYTRQWSALG